MRKHAVLPIVTSLLLPGCPRAAQPASPVASSSTSSSSAGMGGVTSMPAAGGAGAGAASVALVNTTSVAGMPAAGAVAQPSAGMSAAGSGGMLADMQGVALAQPGDSKSDSHAYLSLGDYRLLVNKWGSDELKCDTTMKVFVNTDKTFGWSFERGSCGGNKQKPDYPEIEFGIHPFGSANASATTPTFSSTQVLPMQIKDVMSASVVVDHLTATIKNATTWNIDVELWLSERNPLADADPGVYAELIAFWGWQDGWGCDKSGDVTAGDKTYSLCHQDDHWGDGWRYYQFRASDGSASSYSGSVDVKAFIDWLVKNHSFSTELWLTRIEVGSEIDDNTAGAVTLQNLTIQLNGVSKSARLGP